MISQQVMVPISVLTCGSSLVKHFMFGMQDLSESVVVEPYQASSECVEFSVTVLGSSKGPVVLLPTEVESYDMEDDLCEAALDFEVYKARREVGSSSSSSVSSPLWFANVAALLLHLYRLLLALPMWQLLFFIFVVPSLFCQCGCSSSPFLYFCPAAALRPASSAHS